MQLVIYCLGVDTHTRACVHAHAHTHTHTHTHTRMHMHIYKHTYIRTLPPESDFKKAGTRQPLAAPNF